MDAQSLPRIQDWRFAPALEASALLSAEAAEWQRQLAWDVRTSWRNIEPARAAGRLPGFVARRTNGDIAGWCWFLEYRQCLQVGALVSSDHATTAALVAAILDSPEARRCTSQVWCVRDGAPGLSAALADAKLTVGRYLYLQAALDEAGGEPIFERAWRRSDIARAAHLCAVSYGNADVRPFAPHGTPDEWHAYVASLFDTDGCGTVLPGASFMVEEEPNGPLLGAVVVTTIAEGVAHVAQLVVSPDARGVGMGKYLLRGAMSASAWHGARTMTLLVAEQNIPARRLYQAEGFTPRAEFVVGTMVGTGERVTLRSGQRQSAGRLRSSA